MDYVIKDGVSGGSSPHTPHCEWFCSQLGELVGIPSPAARIIQHPSGAQVFGSRWEGGILDAARAGHWWDRVRGGAIALDQIKGALSRIYAFDQFVHNVDRHANNFIIRDQHSGTAILANDYSRAWICNGFPLPTLPMPDTCTTIAARRFLASIWGVNYIDAGEVNKQLDKISNITQVGIEYIIDGHPTSWLSSNMKDDILKWWGSSEMIARLDGIKKGVADGSYL